MALKIRLQRQGKKGRPIYRIVAVDESKKRDGKVLDVLGFYNPLNDNMRFKIDSTRLDQYIKVGAQMTETVKKLYLSYSDSKPDKAKNQIR